VSDEIHEKHLLFEASSDALHVEFERNKCSVELKEKRRL